MFKLDYQYILVYNYYIILIKKTNKGNTMDQLTIYSPEITASQESAESPDVERVESSIYLEPGTYWRCKEDHQPPEDWEENRIFTPSFSEGELLLLRDVHTDEDGYIHNVELLLTPERQRGYSNPDVIKLLVKDFHRYFSFEENGEKIRRQQTEEETRKLTDIQSDITDIQANPQRLINEIANSDDEDYQDVRNLLSRIKALPSPQAGTNLVSMQDAENSKDQLEAKIEIAKATEVVLNKVNKKLTSQVALIGTYHSEVGQLALARTKEARELVGKVSSALESLDIYLGKDVDIHPVKSGKRGNPNDKFKVYQDMLFMDEESLIHAEYGGADFEDVNQFLDMVAEDDSLVSRLFPFERCMIIIRPRRRTKNYEGGSPFENAMKNRQNQLSFLMIRDGENIHAIFHPMGFMTQLFPSQKEMESAFRKNNWNDCRNITKDDIAYTDSLSASEKLRRQYKRIVLMLQGIYERDEEGVIFGEIPVQERLHLLNPAHQAQLFDFVSLSNAVDDSRMPAYDDWFASLNNDIRVGSLVYITKYYIGPDNTPGIYSHGQLNNYTNQNWELSDYKAFFSEPHIIRKHGNKIGIKAEFIHHWEDKTRNFVIEVNPKDTKGIYDMGKIRSSHIDYYLNSRKARVHYASYIHLLRSLKAFAEVEEQRTLAVRQAVSQVIADRGEVVDEDLVFQSVMKYRADNNGEFDPQCHQDTKELEKILNLYWQLNGGAESMSDKIINHFDKEQVICIVSDAKNTLFVYTLNEDKALSEDKTGFPWLSRYKVENSVTMRFSSLAMQRISEIQGKYNFIYKSEDFDKLSKRQDDIHKLTFRQFKNWIKRFESVKDSSAGLLLSILERIESSVVDDDLMNDLLDLMESKAKKLQIKKNLNQNWISQPVEVIPLGMIFDERGKCFAMRASFQYKKMVSLALQKMSKSDRDRWKNTINRRLYDILRNSSQAQSAVIDAESSEINLRFGLHEIEEAPVGLFCDSYDNWLKGDILKLRQGNESYYGESCVKDISQAYYIDTFLQEYPALSKVLKKSVSEPFDGNVHENDYISLYDFRSFIAKEKETFGQ